MYIYGRIRCHCGCNNSLFGHDCAVCACEGVVNDCGSACYTVCGEEFSVERDFFGENETVESPFFDKAENIEDYNEELADEVEGLIEQLQDEIRCLVPSMDDVDSQVAAYAEANGITDYEVVWYEDFDEESFYSDDEDDSED